MDHHHFVHGGFKHRIIDQVGKILLVTPGQELHGLGGPHRSVLKTFAVGIFAEAFNDGAVVTSKVVQR